MANDLINSLARLNIARIELSKENYSNALEVLDSFNSESEHPMVYEMNGDALAGLGKTELSTCSVLSFYEQYAR